MILSIPVSDFIDPPKGSRAWNAINRAINLNPAVDFIGESHGEKYFRVCAPGHDRHCVIRWYSDLEQREVISCDCEAYRVPISGPTHCFHVGSVLIHEAMKPQKEKSDGSRANHRRVKGCHQRA
jgi:hypothetical protein